MGYSRQYYYKQKKDHTKRNQQEEAVLQLVLSERKLLPRVGARKLLHMIEPKLVSSGLRFGRDRLFELLRRKDMLVRPVRRYQQTTMSRHWMKKYPNLTKDFSASAPDELWVSDITYIQARDGTSYLNLVTDAFSRRIVGHAVYDSMEASLMVRALDMAIKHRRNSNNVSTIHHSDRGLQYCSQHYTDRADKHNIRRSMTENSDPYENALAERMNRTIKEEFGFYAKSLSRKDLPALVAQAVHLYNTKRPHLALNYKTPDEVYRHH